MSSESDNPWATAGAPAASAPRPSSYAAAPRQTGLPPGMPAVARPSGEFSAPPEERYRSRQLLGSGGMGRVVRVHDRRLDREVALKVSNPEVPLTASLDVRLAREARLTARLDHPGIVPIFDAGLGPDGRAYYTMPIVHGRTLGEVLARTTATDERLRLLRRVLEACEAVGYAHREGIVHCDLKPANIMLGEGGGTRVLDWGLARLRGEIVPGAVGTPQYMSPEQAHGAPADTSTDVWSLGAVLYEVCAGRPLRAPGTSTDVLARARAETASGPQTPPLDSGLAPALVAIVTRALEVRPEVRYPDAQALAQDLAAFLDGRRVTAHAYSPRELLGRFLVAWRVPLAVAAVALVVVAVLVVVGMRELGAEAARASLAEGQAKDALADASSQLAHALLTQALGESEDGARPEAELLAAHALTHAESPLARGVLAAWGVEPAPGLLSRSRIPSCLGVEAHGDELYCHEEHALSAWTMGPSAPVLRWRTPMTATQSVVRGPFVVVRTSFRELAWLERDSGRVVGRQIVQGADKLGASRDHITTWDNGGFWFSLGPADPGVRGFACTDHGILGSFAPAADSDRWSALCGDGRLTLGTFTDIDRRQAVDTSLADAHLALSLVDIGDDRLVAGTADGDVVLLERTTGKVLQTVHSGFTKVLTLAASPHGRWVAAMSAGGDVVIIEPHAGVVRGRLPFLEARAVVFDGSDLVVVGRDHRRWGLVPGSSASLDVGAGITSVALDPAGTLLAVATGTKVHVRRLGDGARVAELTPPSGFIKSGAFSPTAPSYHASFANDAMVRSWSAKTWQALPDRALPLHSRRLVVFADGSFGAAHYNGGFFLYAPDSSNQETLIPTEDRLADCSGSSDGQFAVALHEEGGMISRIVLATRSLSDVAADLTAAAVAISADGALIASGGSDGIRLWSAPGGELVGALPTPASNLGEVALSPDGRWVAGGGIDGSVWLFELRERRLAAKLEAHSERVPTLAFSSDSHTLASGSWDAHARLIDLRALDIPAVELVRLVEARWGLALGDVLRRTGVAE